jgi:hypothetical protein
MFLPKQLSEANNPYLFIHLVVSVSFVASAHQVGNQFEFNFFV